MTISDRLAANLDIVRQRIAAACGRCGRSADDVTLVAVTKYAELDWVRGLYDLGLRDFGESRPQQLVERAGEFPADVQWHLIGHLQRNKAALVLQQVAWIHSVDSLRLVQQLSLEGQRQDFASQILLEINTSGEDSKDGFSITAIEGAWMEIVGTPCLDVGGLMTMAPQSVDPESSRPFFRRLREIRDQFRSASNGLPLPDLSMGMSGDFEIGIEEGATMIRVGSALFEGVGKA